MIPHEKNLECRQRMADTDIVSQYVNIKSFDDSNDSFIMIPAIWVITIYADNFPPSLLLDRLFLKVTLASGINILRRPQLSELFGRTVPAHRRSVGKPFGNFIRGPDSWTHTELPASPRLSHPTIRLLTLCLNSTLSTFWIVEVVLKFLLLFALTISGTI